MLQVEGRLHSDFENMCSICQKVNKSARRAESDLASCSLPMKRLGIDQALGL